MAQLVDYLRRHPFPVVAWFERVVAVSFAFPEEILRPLVPKRLEIDTYDGFGFITVAMVWTKNLRPAGVPAFLGQDFLLAGYRVFTRLNDGQRRLRGLRIIRSETDRRRMVWLGNLLTRYRYRYVTARVQEANQETRVQLARADGTSTLDLAFTPANEGTPLPEGSPFTDWKTARRFAGPMPFTFSDEEEDTFVVIEGSRQNWVPRPVLVRQWRVAIFDEEPLRKARPILANAFAVHGVAYRWEKGRIVRLGSGA